MITRCARAWGLFMARDREFAWSNELRIWWPDRAHSKGLAFGVWMQRQAHRLVMGVFRYDGGLPLKRARYLTRLEAEVAAYRASGNMEHLLNAANYCFLESQAPEREGAYFDARAKSVTRTFLKLLGGAAK
jgi:hypothetical protein